MPSKEVLTFWLDMGAPISLLSFNLASRGCVLQVRMPGQVGRPMPPALAWLEIEPFSAARTPKV